MLCTAWEWMGSLRLLPPAHLWEAAINFYSFNEADALGTDALGSQIELLQAGFCICFSSPALQTRMRQSRKQQASVKEISIYLLGHKSASLALSVQHHDFKACIFQNATIMEAKRRGQVFKGNQYTVALLDKKENRGVLRALYNLSPP